MDGSGECILWLCVDWSLCGDVCLMSRERGDQVEDRISNVYILLAPFNV